MAAWDPAGPGVLTLPSGRMVRGRALRRAVDEDADVRLVLQRDPPPAYDGETWWLPWPDFGTPDDPALAHRLLTELWRRAADDRVEVACRGGRGRTGTALACLAVLDGVPPDQAVGFVRRHYRRLAVETPAQARFVRSLRTSAG